MTFDPKRDAGHYIAVDVPVKFNPTLKNPGRRLAGSDETAPEEPIGVLRARLVSGWLEFLQKEAAKRGNDANVEYLRENDSLCRFFETTPEGPLRKWAVEHHEDLPSITAVKKAALRAACRVLFDLASALRRVSLEELLASKNYRELDNDGQWAARFLIDLQRQRPDGSWTLQQN